MWHTNQEIMDTPFLAPKHTQILVQTSLGPWPDRSQRLSASGRSLGGSGRLPHSSGYRRTRRSPSTWKEEEESGQRVKTWGGGWCHTLSEKEPHASSSSHHTAANCRAMSLFTVYAWGGRLKIPTPPRRDIYIKSLELVNATLFGQRVFTDVVKDFEMRLSCINWVGIKYHHIPL